MGAVTVPLAPRQLTSERQSHTMKRIIIIASAGLLGVLLLVSTATTDAIVDPPDDDAAVEVTDYVTQWLPSPDGRTVVLSGLVGSDLVRGVFGIEVPWGAMADPEWMATWGYTDDIPDPATVTFVDGEVLELPAGSRLVSTISEVTIPLPAGVSLQSPFAWGAFGQTGSSIAITTQTDADGTERFFLDDGTELSRAQRDAIIAEMQG